MGHALSLGFLQFAVVLPASRGFIVGKVITSWRPIGHKLLQYHHLQLVIISFACIKVAATIIIEIIAF